MKGTRPQGALLAGVCSALARLFHCNVWLLRALFVVFALVSTLWALLLYGVLAAITYALRFVPARPSPGRLRSPELSRRDARIASLERRLSDV